MARGQNKKGKRPSIFGVRLKEIRLERGLSQRDVEISAGLGSGTISKCESGEIQWPLSDAVVPLCTALDCDPFYLFGGDDE